MCQSDDEIAPREGALALYDAFASIEKSMHANPGGHLDVPPFERDQWAKFCLRHLGPVALLGA